MMKLINLPITKWANSAEQMKAIWRAEGQGVEEQTNVLWVNWTTKTDCLYIDADEITKMLKKGPTTKRKL